MKKYFDFKSFKKDIKEETEKVLEKVNVDPAKVTAGINKMAESINCAYKAFIENTKKERMDVINNRQDANRQIIKELAEFIEDHPELRFTQLLYIMNVIRNDVDTFNEESINTLKTIQAYKIDYNNKFKN